jgi:hypothetical protein
MASRVATRQGDGIRTGFAWDGTELRQCNDLQVRTQWSQDDYHRVVEVELMSDGGRWKARGTVLSLIPVRNRRQDADGKCSGYPHL